MTRINIDRVRDAAEKVWQGSVRVVRPLGPTTDRDTGAVTDSYDVIYEGVGSVVSVQSVGEVLEQHTLVTDGDVVLIVPVLAPSLMPDDVVTYTGISQRWAVKARVERGRKATARYVCGRTSWSG